MAKKTTKLTTFKSSETVVTDDFMNSVYGGLHGSDKQSLYSSTDPLVYGHVHDGEHADGHAQKIDLSKHVIGSLDISFLAGTIDGPSDPNYSFQFNNNGSFGGANTFFHNPSDGSIQLSKNTDFWFGTSDSENSFYIEHEVDGTTSILEFYAVNSVDSEFKFTNGIAGSTDVIINLKNNTSYIYPTGTGYAGVSDGSFGHHPFQRMRMIDAQFFNTRGETYTADYVVLNAYGVTESYSLELPQLQPVGINNFMKTISAGASVRLTWDNISSLSGSPGLPYMSFQFNSSDSFAGSPTLLYTNTGDVVFSKNQKWYFGSVDDANHFWMEYETVDSLPVLEFYAGNSVDSDFKFTNGISGTTDVIIKLKNNSSYIYPTGTGYAGVSNATIGYHPFEEVNAVNAKLFNSSGTTWTTDYINITAEDVKENYNLQLPKYRPGVTGSSDLILKTIQGGINVELTWDNINNLVSGSFTDDFIKNTRQLIGGNQSGAGGYNSPDYGTGNSNSLYRVRSGHTLNDTTDTNRKCSVDYFINTDIFLNSPSGNEYERTITLYDDDDLGGALSGPLRIQNAKLPIYFEPDRNWISFDSSKIIIKNLFNGAYTNNRPGPSPGALQSINSSVLLGTTQWVTGTLDLYTANTIDFLLEAYKSTNMSVGIDFGDAVTFEVQVAYKGGRSYVVNFVGISDFKKSDRHPGEVPTLTFENPKQEFL